MLKKVFQKKHYDNFVKVRCVCNQSDAALIKFLKFTQKSLGYLKENKFLLDLSVIYSWSVVEAWVNVSLSLEKYCQLFVYYKAEVRFSLLQHFEDANDVEVRWTWHDLIVRELLISTIIIANKEKYVRLIT